MVEPPIFGQTGAPSAKLERLARYCQQLRLPYRTERDMDAVLREYGCHVDNCSLDELLQRMEDAYAPQDREEALGGLQRALHKARDDLKRLQHQRKKARCRRTSTPGAPPGKPPPCRKEDVHCQCDNDDNRETAPTLVRHCRDAGVALVPCDPMESSCPPDERLEGTPYAHMYTSLGERPHQLMVRCVPPEMIRVRSGGAPEEALTVEQREKRLDARFHAAMDRVDRSVDNLKKLHGWTVQAPCSAVQHFTGDAACTRMRFQDNAAGRRCMYSAGGQKCSDNLVEARRKVDAASIRIVSLVRRMRDKLQRIMRRTRESTLEESLSLVVTGMEAQVHAEHTCSMFKGSKDKCMDKDRKFHGSVACTYNETNKSCSAFSCNNLSEMTCNSASHNGIENICHYDRLQEPARCRPTRKCNDHNTKEGCSLDNQCMWANTRCVNGVDVVYHLMDAVQRAEKTYKNESGIPQLADMLVKEVMQKGNIKPFQRIDDAQSASRRGGRGGVLGAGGLAPATLTQFVKMMAHMLRHYNTVLRLGRKLAKHGGATYQDALRVDGTCADDPTKCIDPYRHKATEHITWGDGAEEEARHHPPQAAPAKPEPAAATSSEAAPSSTLLNLASTLTESFEPPHLELENDN